MPRLSADVAARLSPTGRKLRLSKYRRHEVSGQALVTFSGRDYYLGAYGTPASRIEYERRFSE